MKSGLGFWMDETSGVLRPAVEAYLNSRPLTSEHVAALRAYLRQWIDAPVWRGPDVDELRREVISLTSEPEISAWLAKAEAAGIDPL